MQTALRTWTRILPGKRIDVTLPDLPEEGEVELIVMLPESDIAAEEAPVRFSSAAEYLDSLPPITRTPEEWAEIERQFRAERDSWDR